MSDGDAALAALVARLRGMQGLARETAREAAPLVEEALRETAAAGTTPTGEAWPTKRDGTRALPSAAKAITVAARGLVVVAKLVGSYVYHDRFKGKDRRKILPTSGEPLPPKVLEALELASKRAFARLSKR